MLWKHRSLSNVTASNFAAHGVKKKNKPTTRKEKKEKEKRENFKTIMPLIDSESSLYFVLVVLSGTDYYGLTGAHFPPFHLFITASKGMDGGR